jgi:hypothetical protein
VTLGWKAGAAVQLEQVERVEVGGQPWLRILSLVGPQVAILPEAALPDIAEQLAE